MLRLIKHKLLVGIFVLVAMWALGANSSPAQEPIKLRYFTGMTASHYYCATMIPSFMKEKDNALS